ncbi:MAG: antibiotic biosynthesis monooxygenase [Desulfobacteraceae bacterium]|jgi:quinol monooxygenase YgiN|nr:MAG: antibiotic biosynthesis monooxygenase [Desulfobacteraceae bacterium]
MENFIMIVVAKLKARQESIEEMKAALLDMVSKVKDEEGTLVYTLHQDLGNPAVFLFYEKYMDADALTAHSSTPYFKALFKTIRPMLDGDPEIAMYDELKRKEG